jgi:hypothetical protein
MCDCSALRFDDHLPVAYQDQLLHWLAFARDFGSWLKRSPTADFNKLRQLFPAQAGKSALAEQMQLLHVSQTMLIGDQTDYLIQVDDYENDVPANARVHGAAGHSEVQDLKHETYDGDDAQPKNIRHPVRERNQNVRHVPWDIGPGNT